MRLTPQEPPRPFQVGVPDARITLNDCGKMSLQPDEQITFVTEQGGEYDVVRKSWGFYATPSLNGRLPRFGLRPVLARSSDGKFFIKLVEQGWEAEFEKYMEQQAVDVVCWLDKSEVLEEIRGRQTKG